MRHIISMSRRVTCNERRKRDRRGERGREGGCRKHAMTQTGWRLSEPLLYPAKSTCTEPLRDAHNLVHKTYIPRARYIYSPLVPGIVITGSGPVGAENRYESRDESSLARPFFFRNIYDHFRPYSFI